MKFLLIGSNGKMGKTIINLAKEYNDIIVCGIDTKPTNSNIKTYEKVDDITEFFDAVIDFSSTEDHTPFINLAVKNNVPYGLFSTLINTNTKKSLVLASSTIPILACKNASIGVNLVYEMLNLLAEKLPDCDCIIQEYHHKGKADKPSGTAREIEKILETHNIEYATHSYRVGKETGTHTIQFFLNDETITLTHTAQSRDVFARGAILAMHNLIKKENGIYYNP